MPQATNLTLKDQNDVDVVFTLLTPAAGNSPAVWVAKSSGTSPATQDKIECSSVSKNGVRTAIWTLKTVDRTENSSGKEVANGSHLTTLSDAVANNVGDAVHARASALAKSLVATTLYQETSTSGFAGS